jgi:hypothetical protein
MNPAGRFGEREGGTSIMNVDRNRIVEAKRQLYQMLLGLGLKESTSEDLVLADTLERDPDVEGALP